MNIKEAIKKFIPPFVLQAYHYGWSLLGAVIFGFPGQAKDMKIIGVTGTSGKSTTVDFITRILQESGDKVASISSIRFKLGEKEWENKYKMTMPGRFVVQKFLKQAKDEKCNYVVLEITSEGIKQFRHKFINFDTAVFTNLTPEHIESHNGFENYRSEKLKLFKVTKNIHIVNTDDKNTTYFWALPAKEKISFGIINKNQSVLAKDIKTKGGLRFKVDDTEFNLNLMGEFNVYNALAAIAVAKSEKISLDTCKKALEKAKGIAGRMEVIQKNPFEVVVDYAHTPDQLEAVYKSFEGKNLVCVLGACGGGRDKWKRPILGQIAGKYCKEIFITNEDPYDEDPLEIMEAVAVGVDGKKEEYHIIVDRKEAIQKAADVASSGDVVIITGKGSEPWMCLKNGKKIPWSDKQIVLECLNNM